VNAGQNPPLFACKDAVLCGGLAGETEPVSTLFPSDYLASRTHQDGRSCRIEKFPALRCILHSRIANNEPTKTSPMTRARGNPQTSLRPQDLLVLLRLSLVDENAPSYAELAAELGLTASEVHAAVARAMLAKLARKDEFGRPKVLLEPLRLFVQHGARYCFPAVRGCITRGVPTSYAAQPLASQIVAPASELPPAWPFKNGAVRGETLHPLYPSVPAAALRSPALYELLALFDAIRAGSPREHALAVKFLDARWHNEI
jgi:hypothetical protein